MSRRLVPVIALALFSLPASAYTLLGIDWGWQDHPIEDPWTIELSSFPTDAGSTTEIAARFTAAMDTWNAEARDVTLAYDGTGTADLAVDGFSTVQYGTYAGLGGALAFASTWSYEDGAMVDCDLFFLDENDYGAIYWDADASGPASGRYDIEAVALHELGHCLGFDHSTDSSAVMYAYYGGLRDVASDDRTGLRAMYGAACDDADGDGWLGCDLDCDDENAAIHPGAAEVCDGVDGDCDRLIDADTRATVTFGNGAVNFSSGWASVGNVFFVEEDTTLVSASAEVDVAADERLVWSVYRSDDGSSWEMVLTDRQLSTSDPTQESAELWLGLEAGSYYVVNLGTDADTASFSYDITPDLAARGPITPVGATYGRPMADDLAAADAGYLWNQDLVLLSPADADADGVTGLCGDCDDDDASVGPTAAEACNGRDDDCDDDVDEDFAADADGDGTIDCMDVCPDDADDDADGDGVCGDEDPCPDDPDDTCDDPTDSDPPDSGAPGDSASPDPDDSGGGKSETPACGCDATAGAPVAWGALALLLTRRRR